MPTLNKRDGEQKRQRQKKAAQVQAQRARVKVKEPEVEEPTEDLESVEVAAPFSDGLVSPQFRAFPRITRAADAETELLRSFLRYFSLTGPFVGTVSTKVSFMKKKGKRLL